MQVRIETGPAPSGPDKDRIWEALRAVFTADDVLKEWFYWDIENLLIYGGPSKGRSEKAFHLMWGVTWDIQSNEDWIVALVLIGKILFDTGYAKDVVVIKDDGAEISFSGRGLLHSDVSGIIDPGAKLKLTHESFFQTYRVAKTVIKNLPTLDQGQRSLPGLPLAQALDIALQGAYL